MSHHVVATVMVVDKDTHRCLHYHTFNGQIQIAPWAHGDEHMEEILLDAAVRLRGLVDFRRRVAAEPELARLIEHKNWTIEVRIDQVVGE